MHRFGLAALWLLAGTLAVIPATLAEETHTGINGPIRLSETSGEPAYAGHSVMQLAQSTDTKKVFEIQRSPSTGTKNILEIQRFQTPAATSQQMIVQGNKIKAGSGFILELVNDKRITARRIGGGLGISADCLCYDKSGKSTDAGCELSSSDDVAICSRNASRPCSGKCSFNPPLPPTGVVAQ